MLPTPPPPRRPAGSRASYADAQRNRQCTGHVGQTDRGEAAAGHTGGRGSPHAFLGCSGLPTSKRPGGRAGAVPEGWGGGELGGLGGEEAGLLHCLYPAAPACP